MSYIGIEGSSYVGKTTTAEVLGVRGYSTIPEYDSFGPFPDPRNTLEGLSSTIDQLVERERIRTIMLGSYATQDHVFSDRTPISFLTFEDMRLITAKTVEQQDLHRRTKDYALSRIFSEVEKGNIVLPEGIAVLALLSRDNFYARVLKRGVTSVSEFASFDIQDYIAKQSLGYADSLIGSSSTILLQADNVDEDELATAVETFADTINKKQAER